jgi:hypothetical protein
MSQKHVTHNGKCIYCGSVLTQCPICQEWFLSRNANHIYCRSRCRTRKLRQLRLKDLLTE